MILLRISTRKNNQRQRGFFIAISAKLFLFVLLVLVFSNLAFPQQPTPKQSERIKKLENSLLAPCCYGEPVSRHMSEISFQMRHEIEDKVMAGESDRDILDHYKRLYGEQVLMEPEGTKRIVLYSMPIMISLLGLAIVFLFLRHALRRPLSRQHAATRITVDARFTEAIRNATDES
jgi:cytochrome c-type biogenesis protein CcmH